MRYIRTKDGRIIDTTKIVTGSKYMDFATNDENFRTIFKTEPLAKSDNLAELCDCFIIKFVESNHFSMYDKEDYSGARYVYEHDSQNTTCILYGVIETETALNYVARESYKGLILL